MTLFKAQQHTADVID